MVDVGSGALSIRDFCPTENSNISVPIANKVDSLDTFLGGDLDNCLTNLQCIVPTSDSVSLFNELHEPHYWHLIEETVSWAFVLCSASPDRSAAPNRHLPIR